MTGNGRQRRIDLTGPLTQRQAAEVAAWYEILLPQITRQLCARGSASARIAEEVAQDVFVRVIEIAPRLATMTPAGRRAYVVQMAHHLHDDLARRALSSRRVGEIAYLGAFRDVESLVFAEVMTPGTEWLAHNRPETNPEQMAAARIRLQLVWEATPGVYRALVLLLAQGYTQVEMAATLGTSEKAVAMRLLRLRRLLAEAGIGDSADDDDDVDERSA